MGRMRKPLARIRGREGSVGPIGTLLYGLALVMLIVGVTAAASGIAAVIRDQSAYASLVSSAGQEAAHAVSTRALANGEAVLDTAHAGTAFQNSLTGPEGGGLTPQGTDTYKLGSAGPANTDAPTAQELTLPTQSFTASPGQVALSGGLKDPLALPVIGQVAITVPESAEVAPKAVWTNETNAAQ